MKKSRLYRPDPIRKTVEVPPLKRVQVPLTPESPSYKRFAELRKLNFSKTANVRECRKIKREKEKAKEFLNKYFGKEPEEIQVMISDGDC